MSPKSAAAEKRGVCWMCADMVENNEARFPGTIAMGTMITFTRRNDWDQYLYDTRSRFYH